MTALEYLYQKVVCTTKPSRLGGVGLFAVRDIEVGEHVFEPWLGESGIYWITQEELLTLPKPLQINLYETFNNKISYIDNQGQEQNIPKEYGKIFFPLQKGCYWVYVWPKMFMNSGLSKANVDSNEHTLPLVIKKIKEGEEILGNYGTQFKSRPKNFL